MKFKVGGFVRVRGRTWIAEVLEVAEVGRRFHYRIYPIVPRKLETSYWWEESFLESASILEAMAEAASDDEA